MPNHSSNIIGAQALCVRRCGVSQKVVATNYAIPVETLRHWEGNFCQTKRLVWGAVFRRNQFSGSTVNFCPKHVIHFLKVFHAEIHLRYLGPFLVHPWRHQNFAGKLHIRSYNIWDCVVTQMESIVKKYFHLWFY